MKTSRRVSWGPVHEARQSSERTSHMVNDSSERCGKLARHLPSLEDRARLAANQGVAAHNLDIFGISWPFPELPRHTLGIGRCHHLLSERLPSRTSTCVRKEFHVEARGHACEVFILSSTKRN